LAYRQCLLLLTTAKLVATDIAHAVPLAVFAGLGHLMIGHVDIDLLGTLLLGSLPGVDIEAKLSAILPSLITRVAPAMALFAVAVKILMV